MRRLILILIFLPLSLPAFSQKSGKYIQYIEQLKSGTQSDKNDKTVLKLLNDFYEQALQGEDPVLSPEISKQIQKLYSDKGSKNMQILNMFLAYQDYISSSASGQKQPDPGFQVNLMDDLEKEVTTVYGNIPIIIEIYKAEALKANGQRMEAADVVASSLGKFPDSIALKVYKYLNSKDEAIKEDLIKNHANRWMVQSFAIQ